MRAGVRARAPTGAARQALRLIETAKDGHLKGYADLPAVLLLLDATLQARRARAVPRRRSLSGARQAAGGLADRATLEKLCPYALLRQMYVRRARGGGGGGAR